MSLTARMLVALIAGLLAGLAATHWGGARFNAGLLATAEPLGRLWVNALQMTLIPLVVALIITAVASVADTRAMGRLGARSLVIFLALLAGTGIVTGTLAPPLVASLPIDPSTTAALIGDAAATAGAAASANVSRMPTIGQMVSDIIPPNPVRAAADTAMLPLVMFALLLGLAATRIAAERRELLVGFFRALADAMFVIVEWVIRVGPIGVLALGIVLAMRIGLNAAGLIVLYMAILSGIIIVVTLLLYVVAVVFGGVSLRSFARALVPPQAVAFSTRSSLASLPAMVESARTRLVLPPAIVSFVLPLAVATLRLSGPIMWSVTLPFLARLYGVDMGYGQLLSLIAVSILLSFSVPGVPSGSLLLMAPFLAGLRIPPEALGIAIAADAIPDIFKTVLNVTGHMTAATVAARFAPEEGTAPAVSVQSQLET
jgi:Na+/H+-dicarboxylate symporter